MHARRTHVGPPTAVTAAGAAVRRGHHRKASGGGSPSRHCHAAAGWEGRGARGRFGPSEGRLPVGPFLLLSGRGARVHRHASARDDLLDGLDELASLQLGGVVLPGGDEEQPPQDNQQLCEGRMKKDRDARGRAWYRGWPRRQVDPVFRATEKKKGKHFLDGDKLVTLF